MSEVPTTLGGECTIELMAGRHPNGEMVVEKLLVTTGEQENSYRLLKSPLFVGGIANGDVIQQLPSPRGAFNILQHGGNLCIRVFSKAEFNQPQPTAIEQQLTAKLEKLGGSLDLKTPKALVYSIHVSCGFNDIEKLLDEALAGVDDMAWYYGNVYDPDNGEPLNWWQAILSPE